MLPLIPALILLLLQSATGYDRAAVAHRSPFYSPYHEWVGARINGSGEQSQVHECRQALAKLIAATGDANLSAAFFAMFAPSAEFEAKAQTNNGEPKHVTVGWTEQLDHGLAEGFSAGGRTRDGPSRL